MPKKSTLHTMVTSLFIPCLLALGASACAPTLATRGNYLDDDRLASIQQNVSTKDEVEQKLGTPTTKDPFDDNTWFYIGEKTATKSFLDPKVESRKIIVLRFSKEGLLQTAEQVDETSGKRIDIVTKETPTPGKEMNAFQQFLGNIGKFNSPGAGGGTGNGNSPGR